MQLVELIDALLADAEEEPKVSKPRKVSNCVINGNLLLAGADFPVEQTRCPGKEEIKTSSLFNDCLKSDALLP